MSDRDEIKHLEAEVARLRAALERIARLELPSLGRERVMASHTGLFCCGQFLPNSTCCNNPVQDTFNYEDTRKVDVTEIAREALKEQQL